MKIRYIFFVGIAMLLGVSNGTINGQMSTFKCGNYSNEGVMKGDNLNLIVYETLSNNGTIAGTESITIECSEIEGKGIIKGPKLEILAHDFNFIGIIECSKECTITSQKPINKSQFKRSGKGKFIFKVNPDLKLSSTQESDTAKFTCNPASAQPNNPLPAWWNNIAAKNLQENYKICRVCVQIDANKKERDEEALQKIKAIAVKICNFLQSGYRFSKSPMQDLYDLLMKIPYQDIEQGNIKGITCKNSVRVVKVSNIKGKMDNDLDPSEITLATFAFYDPLYPELNDIFSEKKLSTLEAINLYFVGAKLANDKGLSSVNGSLYCYVFF